MSQAAAASGDGEDNNTDGSGKKGCGGRIGGCERIGEEGRRRQEGQRRASLAYLEKKQQVADIRSTRVVCPFGDGVPPPTNPFFSFFYFFIRLEGRRLFIRLGFVSCCNW
ncbi:hypothetical protein ABFX02_13G062400 [Erythranthe guttata]